jgi:hypothetical protein
MKPIFFTIILGLGLMAGQKMGWAQNDEKPVPQPPYIQPVPDYGHWKVTFNYKPTRTKDAANGSSAVPSSTSAPGTPSTPPAPPPPSAPDGSPTALETIKTGDLRGITLTFADGTTKQFTCQGDWILNSSANGAQLSIASPTSLPYPYYSTGFIFLDGMKIDPSTFKEAGMHHGVMAFHYKSGPTDVWIDPATMLPKAAKQDGVEISFEFLTPPPRPFPIPKDQADLLQKERAASQATSSMR